MSGAKAVERTIGYQDQLTPHQATSHTQSNTNTMSSSEQLAIIKIRYGETGYFISSLLAGSTTSQYQLGKHGGHILTTVACLETDGKTSKVVKPVSPLGVVGQIVASDIKGSLTGHSLHMYLYSNLQFYYFLYYFIFCSL